MTMKPSPQSWIASANCNNVQTAFRLLTEPQIIKLLTHDQRHQLIKLLTDFHEANYVIISDSRRIRPAVAGCATRLALLPLLHPHLSRGLALQANGPEPQAIHLTDERTAQSAAVVPVATRRLALVRRADDEGRTHTRRLIFQT